MGLTLADLYKWADSVVPEADSSIIPSISTTQLDKRTIFNEAAREFVKIAKPFRKEIKFTCTAGTPSYSISSNITDFAEMREEGMWHLRSDASTNLWDRLKPITMRKLDQKFSNWRSQANSDNIRYYWQDGDLLYTFYTPSSTLTNGFLVYYYGASKDMTNTTDYPFTGSATEDIRLSPYEKYLVSYYESQALKIVGYRSDSKNKLQEFIQECIKAKAELQNRRDLAQSSQAQAKTGMNFGNPFRK